MTVCIAAACEQASKVVVATDRLLSYGGVASESLPGKMIWIGDWLVLYAGSPANTALIIAELRRSVKDALTSENVRQSFYAAYCKRKGSLSSFPFLSPYNTDLETFKKEGLRRFGRSEFARLSQEIENHGFQFNEQLLIVGWGATPNAVMLYEVSSDGDRDHHISGMAAIGAGSEVALSTMLLLGQSRDSSLSETLYRVAAAKFSSEKAADADIGRKTSICISWKRTDADEAERPAVKFLQEAHVRKLYELWDRHGRPRVPMENAVPTSRILGTLGISYRPSTVEANELIRLSLVNQTDSVEPREGSTMELMPGFNDKAGEAPEGWQELTRFNSEGLVEVVVTKKSHG